MRVVIDKPCLGNTDGLVQPLPTLQATGPLMTENLTVLSYAGMLIEIMNTTDEMIVLEEGIAVATFTPMDGQMETIPLKTEDDNIRVNTLTVQDHWSYEKLTGKDKRVFESFDWKNTTLTE